MTQNKTETTCRICLKLPKARSKFISVHNNYRHSKLNQTFAELFQQTTGFHIEACEPQFLCTDCRLKLVKCFQFIQQCKKTQENLRSLTASTANHREIKIYYEEEIFPYAADCNEAYDQNFECNEIANEPGELIVEHDVPEATVAPCTPGMNEPDEQSSICSDSRNQTDEITIEEPKWATNSNDELIVELVVAENREAPDAHGIEEVSVAEPTISENDLKIKENEFVCILGPDPIEDVTESQDFKATDNRFACDQCTEIPCVFESKKKLIAHKYRVHKKTVRCSFCKKNFRLNHFERHKVFCSLILKNKRTTNSMKRFRRDLLRHNIKIRKRSKKTVKIKRAASKKSNRSSPTSESCEIDKPNPNACNGINETDSVSIRKVQNLVNRLEPLRNGYFCLYCKENSSLFESKKSLSKHMLTHLPKSQCPHCYKFYKKIEKHKAECKWKRDKEVELKCNLCKERGFVFKNKKTLEMHINRKHTNVKNVVCGICGKLVLSDYIDRHIEAFHKNPAKFTCDLCPATSYSKKGNLKKHMDRVHLKTKSRKKKYTPVQCTECEKCYDKLYIDQHIKAVHKIDSKFICDLCPDKSFILKQSIKDHMTFNHIQPIKLKLCKICNEGFRESYYLNVHLRTAHTDQYPFYKCPHCEYKTPNLSYFQLHKNRHLGDAGKKHECHTCGKRFITKKRLNDHSISHSDQNSVMCDICGQGFKLMLYLKRHLHRVHLGEKRFECPVCHKKFQKNQDNRSHIEKHHPEYKLPPPGTVLKKNAEVKMSKITRITNH